MANYTCSSCNVIWFFVNLALLVLIVAILFLNFHIVSIIPIAKRLCRIELKSRNKYSIHSHQIIETDLQPLSWTARTQIALDAAKGIEYIHDHTKAQYVHRDIKTSNILLDETLRAKVFITTHFSIYVAYILEISLLILEFVLHKQEHLELMCIKVFIFSL